MKPLLVKKSIDSVIRDTARQRRFLSNPDSDFTRNRKLSYERMIRSILSMGGGSLSNELLELSQFSPPVVPSSSAFVQRRAKISYSAFEYIYQSFTDRIDCSGTYRGYRLLAADGTGLHTPTNPLDVDSFFPSPDGRRPHNLIYLTALYDLRSHIYVDAVVQKGRGDEPGSLIKTTR